ncbi:hypothetical protein SDC9_164130 [bioreactor metagenome]|uniref:Uncharacterized protein n=1 Tax=bioreactor metagenome TaxID=1076179 RepID=A0A645FY14_9ZZZZ
MRQHPGQHGPDLSRQRGAAGFVVRRQLGQFGGKIGAEGMKIIFQSGFALQSGLAALPGRKGLSIRRRLRRGRIIFADAVGQFGERNIGDIRFAFVVQVGDGQCGSTDLLDLVIAIGRPARGHQIIPQRDAPQQQHHSDQQTVFFHFAHPEFWSSNDRHWNITP